MKAVVAGGEIGGLACALALTRHGWDVEVLERAAAFKEGQANQGVIASNAVRKRLGQARQRQLAFFC